MDSNMLYSSDPILEREVFSFSNVARLFFCRTRDRSTFRELSCAHTRHISLLQTCNTPRIYTSPRRLCIIELFVGHSAGTKVTLRYLRQHFSYNSHRGKGSCSCCCVRCMSLDYVRCVAVAVRGSCALCSCSCSYSEVPAVLCVTNCRAFSDFPSLRRVAFALGASLRNVFESPGPE
jgi:hypothetical protein